MSQPLDPVPAPPDLRTAARERLLAAARAVVEADGLAALGIASVARRAGVSRPTVYRHFASRDDLLRQTVLRAATGFADGLRARIEPIDRPEHRALEAVGIAVAELPAHPVLGAAARAFPTRAARAVVSPEALAIGRRALEPLIAAAGWNDVEALESVEVLLRWSVSLAAAPGRGRDDPELRRFLARRLLPAIGLTGGRTR